MALKAHKFNTGRQYTPEGQVIVAWIHSEGKDEFGAYVVVRFFDMSRNITGELNTPLHFVSNDYIMDLYDNGHYKCVSYMPGVEEEKAEALALTA